MNDPEKLPAPGPSARPPEAMTEASGSLTPDDPDGAFVPAERREISDPGAARDVTAAAHRRREARRAAGHDDPGSLMPRGDDMPPNDRDGGYGSEHGLSGDDPAYAEEEHLPRAPAMPPMGGEPRIGGDEKLDPGADRF